MGMKNNLFSTNVAGGGQQKKKLDHPKQGRSLVEAKLGSGPLAM
jgi:hypothetical protein